MKGFTPGRSTVTYRGALMIFGERTMNAWVGASMLLSSFLKRNLILKLRFSTYANKFFCTYNYSCLTQACTLHQNNSDSLFQCSTGPMGPCLPFSSLSEPCTPPPLSSHVPLTPSTFLYSIHRNLPHLNYPPASPTKWKSQKGWGHVSTLFTGHTQHHAWHTDTCWMHEIIYS